LCSLYAWFVIIVDVDDGPADCITIPEVIAALKKIKNKAPGLSGLVAEVIQATGDIGINWLTDLCSNNNNNTFNGLLSRSTRVSRYQKKHAQSHTFHFTI